MPKVPLGKILGVASSLGLGGGVGYGLSRRHDFAVVKANTPGGTVYLSGQRADVEKLKDAAQKGNLDEFANASKRVFVLGGLPASRSPQMQPPPRMRPVMGQGQGQGLNRGQGMSRVAALSQALEMAKTAGKIPGWALGAGGAALGAAAGGAGAYGVMRGRQFAAMNIQTPYGPLPVAGQRRRLEEIVSAAKHGNQSKFEQAMSKVVPLHPAMAGVIAERPKQASFDKLSALNASFFQSSRLTDLDELVKEAGVWSTILSGIKNYGLKGIGWLKGALPKAEKWLGGLGSAEKAGVKALPTAAAPTAASTLKVSKGALSKLPSKVKAPATATAVPTTDSVKLTEKALSEAPSKVPTVASEAAQATAAPVQQQAAKRFNWTPLKYTAAGVGLLGGAGLVAGIHGLGQGFGSTVANTPIAPGSFSPQPGF